ncbi:MAG: tyrosine-type recombinase/integrase [Candidatus Contendobacter sp.]|nr:tyrosine-type recombinase/integrase [Candidatus Contendobacter sp.]MDS4031223.1 tyrosine-type recombinase/integrase [Candidatus Contendobacter sp.]
MAGKLTQKTLEAITPEQQGRKLFDGSNLRGVVRVSKAGEVSVFFVWRYIVAGKARDHYCGTWPAQSLATIRAARDKAAAARKGDGADPALETKMQRMEKRLADAQRLANLQQQASAMAAHRARPTVADVFEHWAKLELTQRKDLGAEVCRAFRKDVLPALGKLAMADVTRAHITGILDSILARGARRLATRTLSELRQLFGFAYSRGYTETDPTYRLRKADFGGSDTERARVLTESEIQTLARQLPAANLYRPTETAIWLLLATGCRIGELTSARWEHIDFQKRVWSIPATKNGRPHVVYLSAFAVRHLDELHALHSNTPWLYPGRCASADAQDHGPLDPKSITRQLADRQRLKTPMNKRTQATAALQLPGGPWTPHDLRRTMATFMGDLGVGPDTIEKCLSHVEPNRIKRTYQRQELRGEQAEAWRVVGERLELLTSTAHDPQNIILGRFGRAA